MAQKTPRFHFDQLDAVPGANIYFERQLDVVQARSFDVKYPKLIALELLPVMPGIDPGAETVSYRQFDQFGVAKFVGTYGRNLPRVDVRGKEFHAKISEGGSAFGYTVHEIEANALAQRNGLTIPLDQRRANAARRANEELIEKTVVFGNTQEGLVGFMQISAALSYTPCTKAAGASGSWLATSFHQGTPDEILKDMNGIVINMRYQTHDIEEPNTILLPVLQYGQVNSTARSSTSDLTILEYFKRNNPGIDVRSWFKLAGAGDSTTDRMVAYRRDNEVIEAVVPVRHQQLPPQPLDLEFKIPTRFRCGGVVCHYPLAISFADGI